MGNIVKVVVDLGNSSTKVQVMFGLNRDGSVRKRSFVLSNVFAPCPEGYKVPEGYNYDTSAIIRLNGEKVFGVDMLSAGNYCNGELQEKEFHNGVYKPSPVYKKYASATSYLSLNLVYARVAGVVMSWLNLYDISKLGELQFDTFILLPPGDNTDAGKKAMEELVRSVKRVEMVYGGASFDIVHRNVTVLPEGFCAYLGTVLTESGEVREGYEDVLDSYVVVLDIGAGTSDLVLVDHHKLVNNSMDSIAVGGDMVLLKLGSKLRAEARGSYSVVALRKAIETGVLESGRRSENVVDMVNNLRAEVAMPILEGLKDFLAASSIPLRSVGYLLVVGGGSLGDESIGLWPISQILIRSFKMLAPDVELLKLPTEVVGFQGTNGEYEKKEELVSTRELNLRGAATLALLLG